MEILVYAGRCLIMLLVTWAGIRILGKKSVAQMTAYELAGMMILTTAAAEPLVYKVPSKASIGVLVIAFGIVTIELLSLRNRFYKIDNNPSILILNGVVDKKELKRIRMNMPFLLSLLRSKGYFKVSEVEVAIFEPNGNLSVMPKSQERPVKTKDLKISTEYEGLSLPLVLDGEIQYNNLKYANLTTDWLQQKISKAGANKVEEICLAELDTGGQLHIDLYKDSPHAQSMKFSL